VFSLRQAISIGLRVGTALFIATLGGLFGGLVPPVISDILRSALPDKVLVAVSTPLTWCTDLFTWAITGALIGVSVGTFDIVSNAVRGKELGPALRKIMKGMAGGLLGGFIGGVFSPLVRGAWGVLFHNKPQDKLWLPSASGFIILGMCIGLLIGLAQILLKEAWLRVEQGFRKGREMMLQKDEITLGRAESCDLGLFGDPLVDKLHARLLVQGKQYYIVDAGSATGTFVNEKRIDGPTLLHDGDTIRLGKCVLRFGERTKQQ
jgi:MFS family permease